ncbi:HlyU family transcriptional regulator [Wenxinia saemankumensis]|uniref:Transcriptional activator HlyU n=1 Tax=Wenxinia saemankumensis TaxID=1447782 RepID=A0A1M6GZR7_9RHOB|nr:HlyU family transcriptional regulator [Wenxinia saemankumensis]SHJ15404.1 hypothetical protein SAMN05444417_3022 [Wenxinia saemankumensis]
MSWLSRLLGGGAAAPAKTSAAPEAYKDFLIYPEPQKDGGKWRIAGRVEKGERSHHFVRADTLETEEQGVAESLAKGKLIVDQLGESVFD